MIKYTNKYDIPLSLAIWLVSDEYDYSNDPTEISATTLLKPIRSLLLAQSATQADVNTDIYDKLASRQGTSFHNSIEAAWNDKDNLANKLKLLGYPDKVANNVVVNPSETEDTTGKIVVIMEQRFTKSLDNFTVTGKLDFCLSGALEDFKSTSVYSWIHGSNDENYQKQGSIYRWLRPDIITKDFLSIRYIFTDWSAASARQNKEYPSQKILTKTIPLLSIEETENFIRQTLNKLKQYWGKPQSELPECTSKELWRDNPIWKYYKDPTKTARSTKNFDNETEALNRLYEDGTVGEVKYIPGKVKRCKYCDVVHICTQAQDYIAGGLLDL